MPNTPKVMPKGEVFGRLTVIGDTYLRPRKDGRNRAWVECRCECGNTKHVMTGNLWSGNTTSCGCLHKEIVRERMTTHGESRGYRKSRLLNSWRAMKDRCDNPNAHAYKWYGARGITYDPEWARFEVFKEWALAAGHSPGLELDRRDSDKNYGPENCRWITKKANIRNRDMWWDDDLDSALVAYAAKMNTSPYQVIEDLVRTHLASQSGSA